MTDLQVNINDFLKVPKDFRKEAAKGGNKAGFTAFDPKQQKKATKLTSDLMKVANANPDNPIEKVLEAAAKASETQDPELVRWSLMTFITHHPSARGKNLRLPSLSERAPQLSIPKKKKTPVTAPGPIISDKPATTVTTEQEYEALLDWYREDPNLHEHHEHWHIVYQGVPDPNDPDTTILKDRHGELFVYMHRQMLARYDLERQAMNVPLIKPLDDYRAPIPEGYKPNEQLVDTADDTPYGDREANAVLSDNPDLGISISDMEKSRDRLIEAAESGKFFDGTEINADLFGAILEPSYNVERTDLIEEYDGLHAKGHLSIGNISNPSNPDAEIDPGVMYNTRTAARDPAFWRWHRHIDDIFNKWEKNLPPNDFSDLPPGIKVKDIVLSFKDKLPISHGETQDQEAEAFGEQTFGGDNFDADVSGSEFYTDVLETKMKHRTFVFVEDTGASQEIDYLFPREFYYFFRVENNSPNQVDGTFRVFLAPEELADSQRHWIELDKFKHTLPPNSKTVVCRDCDMSSVVRQPPQKTEEQFDEVTTAVGTEDSPEKQFCDCGWPFHLLLPRGRKGGLNYKLLLIITDWTNDEVPTLSRCGSISFCGAEGPSEKYPDSRPMGYPFDRPFKNNSYKETFEGIDAATIKDIAISWVDDYPEIPY